MLKGFLPVLACLLFLGLTGCVNKDIGVMTYNQAIVTYGPPDKEQFVNGQRVAVWNIGETVRRDRYGIEPRIEKTYNQVVRVFDEKGVLTSESFR